MKCLLSRFSPRHFSISTVDSLLVLASSEKSFPVESRIKLSLFYFRFFCVSLFLFSPCDSFADSFFANWHSLKTIRWKALRWLATILSISLAKSIDKMKFGNTVMYAVRCCEVRDLYLLICLVPMVLSNLSRTTSKITQGTISSHRWCECIDRSLLLWNQQPLTVMRFPFSVKISNNCRWWLILHSEDDNPMIRWACNSCN